MLGMKKEKRSEWASEVKLKKEHSRKEAHTGKRK